MITAEVFVTGRALTADEEREIADRVLRALTTEEAAPDSVMESAREFAHVLVGQPAAWATGGPRPGSAPRYLVRLTVPRSWSNDREFGNHVVPLITEATPQPNPTQPGYAANRTASCRSSACASTASARSAGSPRAPRSRD
jgi:hypothetical protein